MIEDNIEIGKLYRANKKFIVFSEVAGWTFVSQNEIIIFTSVEKPGRYKGEKYKEDPIYIFQILKDNGQLVTKVEKSKAFYHLIKKL